MLDVNPETVRHLIDLAQTFHAQEQVVIPDDVIDPSDDWATQTMAAHEGDTTLEEFRATIRDLEPDQQQQVVALMWLGREDYSLEEWDEALAYAAEAWTPTTADYLISHPMLAEDLAQGLEFHGYSSSEGAYS